MTVTDLQLPAALRAAAEGICALENSRRSNTCSHQYQPRIPDRAMFSVSRLLSGCFLAFAVGLRED
jgi:hypothetical protein